MGAERGLTWAKPLIYAPSHCGAPGRCAVRVAPFIHPEEPGVEG